MNVIIFGGTGMVGQGVLRECLLDSDIQRVLLIVRHSSGKTHAKLREIIHPDFFDFASLASQLTGYEGCFFCLGCTVIGKSEEEYSHLTYDLTLAAAQVLAKQNPGMTFTYVSGMGTDSTERGRAMWARVKGRTENALLRLPFKAAYMFRPGLIVPLHGIRSKTAAYQIPYTLARPILPLLSKLLPTYVTTSEKLGRAMIKAAKEGAPKPILETGDINELINTK